MINALSKILYTLKNNKFIYWIVLGFISLLAWQAVNILMITILGIQDTAWYGVRPSSFIEVISLGSVMWTLVALIALCLIYIPVIALFLWFSGGVKRSIAQHLLFYGISFLLLSVLGIMIFSRWEGYHFLSHPRLVIENILKVSSRGSAFDHRLMISLLASYSLLFIGLIGKYFIAKNNSKK